MAVVFLTRRLGRHDDRDSDDTPPRRRAACSEEGIALPVRASGCRGIAVGDYGAKSPPPFTAPAALARSNDFGGSSSERTPRRWVTCIISVA